ncbi:N-acetylmuramoyl-L-alanine amidase [Candidatus Pacearchaeota archaeon]|nr:N-acetylmuramoyl-L-alanine amidase [Candidatus Pacearchaeota archaeon]
MLNWYKILYNKKSSKSLGWEPEWFGASSFDNELIEKIKSKQKEFKIKEDGLVGEITYRRIYSEKIYNNDIPLEKEIEYVSTNNRILCNNHYFPIKTKAIFLNEGLRYKIMSKERNPKFVVIHWDACLNTRSAINVLKKRGYSVHFNIDNDGTIYQFVDTNDITFHAGTKYNADSIGIELSNAHYLKYQDWYEKKGFGERPIIEDFKIHKVKLDDFLGFYPKQIEALGILCGFIYDVYEIPLVFPEEQNGINKDCQNAKFKGFMNHFNLTDNKIDCASLPVEKVINIAKSNSSFRS